MKKLFYNALPVLALCALAACSEDNAVSETSPVDPYNGKELISLSQEASPITRGAITRAGFTAQTKVYMRIKSEASGKDALWAEATATATANINTTTDGHYNLVNEHSDLSYETGKELYWDDAYGRAAKLTVYAFAIPNKTDATLPTWTRDDWTAIETGSKWNKDTEDNLTVTWDVTTEQNETTMGTKDLTYSNNISSEGKGGRYTHNYNPVYSNDSYPKTLQDGTVIGDGQMQWWPKTIASSTEKTNHSFAATTGKFDQGHLIFKHALAKIEIRLTEGTDFDNTVNTDFKWSENQIYVTQNIKLIGLYTNGTFNVSTGNWTPDGQSTNTITTMHETTGTNPEVVTTRTLFAYVLPGNTLYNNNDNVIAFEIDKAQYYVTGHQIATAIRDHNYAEQGEEVNKKYANFTSIEAGKHYIIRLTVNKKKIDRITAAVINWEDVESENIIAQNTYPTFTFEDRDTKLDQGDANEFNIYRAAEKADSYIINAVEAKYGWDKGYTTDGVASKTWVGSEGTESNLWKTNWFWPDNLTFYHFRATGIYNGNALAPDPTVEQGEKDKFVIHSGELSGSTYKDYLWGAPFKKLAANGKLTYSLTTGFDNATPSGEPATTTHQISQGIGATNSVIHMLLFHMTSQIIVNVNTTTGADKVTLKKTGDTDADKTKVEILNFLPNGTVQMGDGLVTATPEARIEAATMTYGQFTDQSGESPYVAAKVAGYTYGIVPQVLSWTEGTSGTIGLRITTPDGNQYVVKDLSTVKATVTNNNLTVPYTSSETIGGTTYYTIDRWYPNYKYTYNVTVKKTGIERITAAVVDWETVTGDVGVIDLEN